MLASTRPIIRFHLLKIVLSPCYTLKSHFRSVKSSRMLGCQYYRKPLKSKRRNLIESDEENVYDTLDESKLDKLLEKNMLPASTGHRIFVIQPYIKWGALKRRNTTPELQLMESVTLIKTLRQYVVVDKRIVSLQCIRKNYVFGRGVLANLREAIKSNTAVSAVFISLNTLTMAQQANLQEIFEVPVFDRYTIIMNIFKEHARTKEAKLQVQLAQLPYLWSVLHQVDTGSNSKWGISENFFGGSRCRISEKKEVFRKKAAKFKEEISHLRWQRTVLRNKREEKEIPVVAVIGYTNAGKTSLVKALTGKQSLEPKDYLFATLDVSAHIGELPSGLKAYFIDTLGFISDIPTYFIESFTATLEDAVQSHVIVHVRDISHPDTVAQYENVIAILNNLNLPDKTRENIITVGNKIDLLDKKEWEKYKDLILVSSTQMTGINVLRQEIQKKILNCTGIVHIIIRVKSGSSEYFWLHEKATVVKEIPDDKNNQFTYMDTLITPLNLAKFKHDYIKNYSR